MTFYDSRASMTDRAPDLARTTLGVVFIAALMLASVWVVRPFLAATVWATTVVVATWPMMRGMQGRLGVRRGLAVLAMTVTMLMVFFVPLTSAVWTIVENADRITGWAKSIAQSPLPPAPDVVRGLPLVGERVAAAWDRVVTEGGASLSAELAPYASRVMKWFAAEAGSVGLLIVQFLLTVAIAGILYANGEVAADGAQRFARRLMGERGPDVVVLAGKAIRGVALGVVVTALVQSVLGGVGLAVAGVPAAGLLTALMFMLCLAQLGPVLVLLPAVAWLFWTGSSGWATVLLLWTVFVGALDNVLRPLLIKKGVDLPLLLIFAGVIGGLLGFGIVGIFVGPVVLAVTYTLLVDWVRHGEQPGGSAG